MEQFSKRQGAPCKPPPLAPGYADAAPLHTQEAPLTPLALHPLLPFPGCWLHSLIHYGEIYNRWRWWGRLGELAEQGEGTLKELGHSEHGCGNMRAQGHACRAAHEKERAPGAKEGKRDMVHPESVEKNPSHLTLVCKGRTRECKGLLGANDHPAKLEVGGRVCWGTLQQQQQH